MGSRPEPAKGQGTGTQTSETQRLKTWSRTDAGWVTGELTVKAEAWISRRGAGGRLPRAQAGRSEHQENPSRIGSGTGFLDGTE